MLVGGLVRAAKAWGGSMVMMARGAGRQSRPISGGLGWIDGGMRSDDTGGSSDDGGMDSDTEKIKYYRDMGCKKERSINWCDQRH
jgi:hypothetical protein